MNIHRIVSTQVIALTLMVLVSQAWAQNLIENPAFESGNTGFTSTYVHDDANLVPEGRYAILTNPKSAHPAFQVMGDHTSGTGRMLVVNGATTGSRVLWRQTVKVEANKSYLFSAWAANVVSNSPGTFVFRVNGTTLQPQVTLPTSPRQWQNYSTVWESSGATAATLEILFTSTFAGGNDSALDDLMFRRISPRAVDAAAFDAVLLEWPSSLGVDYQVQRSTDLETWFSVGAPMPGTGLNMIYSERRSNPRSFFRVVALD